MGIFLGARELCCSFLGGFLSQRVVVRDNIRPKPDSELEIAVSLKTKATRLQVFLDAIHGDPASLQLLSDRSGGV